MLRKIALFAALMMVAGAGIARAQVGAGTEIISGRVVGPDTMPIAGATVEVTSVATNGVRRTLTRNDGRFQLLFRDGGGQYRLRVTYLGMAPATTTLTRQADEDRLVVNVKMSRVPQQLAAVQVRARGNAPQMPAGAGAGGTQAALPPELLQRMPLNPGDLMASATLAPGVVGVGGTDSTGASFVVAAQPASQNNITVDGVSFLFGGVPQDAVRGTRVITNAYDVSRGQFTGGQVATTTKSGTGQFQGSANFTGRSPSLQAAGSPASSFAQRYSQQMVSGGAGGMLPGPFTDKGYYFVSGQFENRHDDFPSLLELDPAVLAKMGASDATVTRFLDVLRGNGVAVRGTGARSQRATQGASALARFDFDISAAHSVMLRGDWRRQEQQGTRVSPLALPQTGGTSRGNGGGAMGTVTSVFGSFIHEAKLYWSEDRQVAEPYLRGPMGLVSAASTLENGGQGVANLLFGGNPSLPRSQRQSLIEATDELSWISKGNAHRYKLGLLANRDRATVGTIPNRFGTFVYPTLADFEANRPALFSRTIGGTDRLSGTDNAAVYLGDAWRVSPSLQLTYGVRAEGTRLPGAPPRNAAVESAFGQRTDEFPTDVALTPRFGFTYLVGNLTGIPKGVVRGGIGAFRGKVPGALVGSVRQATGLPGGQVQLVCVGPQVTTPDFNAYFNDEATIPTTCADAGPQLPASASALPSVAMFGKDFGAPLVWRASAGGSIIRGARWVFGSDLLVAYGTKGTRGADLNLRAAPVFGLGSEGNRPVYVTPASIPPSGSAAFQASRANGAFGSVTTIGSGLRSRTAQVTVTAQGPSLRSGFFSGSYTWQRSEDQSNGYSFGSYLPTTAGDPRRTEWGTSDLERRHILTGMTLIPLPRDFEFSLIARAVSGGRYTPMVNGDVNGDGTRNDRAFVFAPSASPDTAIANGMQRLLAGGDSRAVKCLRAQLGKVASRNSCATAWTPSVDLQLNYRPTVAKLERRLTISLVAVNTLAGVDQLLHGDEVHGWGQPTFPDRNLLNVRGWDASQNRYLYQVNERFGSRGGQQNPFRIPFQLGLQMNLRVGVDAQKAAMQSIFGTADGKPPTKEALKARIKANFPNPLQGALKVADSVQLNLTAEQKAKLEGLSKAFEVRADSILNIFAEVLLAAGPNPDPAQLGPKLMKPQMEAVRMIGAAVTDLKATLTEEQFKKVPERVRLPFQAPPPQQQRP